jgi:hypothetical protein
MMSKQHGRVVCSAAVLALLGAMVAPSAQADKMTFGPLTVGGAIRANYVYGDYPDDGSGAAQRGAEGGNMELDTFRINLDYEQDALVGKAEYRWYNGYNFLHTGWVGMNLSETDQIQVGVNRTPFGAGPYGISQSYFFDQTYYVGLADDMDLGVKYSGKLGSASLDLGYYYSAQPNGVGTTDEAARYDRDLVPDDDGNGYEERNQFNARLIQPVQLAEGVTSDIGASIQVGELKNKGNVDDGDDATAVAGALHAVTQINNWKLGLQYTAYDYGIDGSDLVNSGFFDYYQTIAAKGQIPSISLSYYHETPDIGWLDYVIPYVEYSTVLKDGMTAETVAEDGTVTPAQDFKDSELITAGAAWGSGGWYVYTEVAYSDGNGFVGGDPFTDVGANLNQTSQYRFNINFGYYF